MSERLRGFYWGYVPGALVATAYIIIRADATSVVCMAILHLLVCGMAKIIDEETN